jgi:hypothetical protein
MQVQEHVLWLSISRRRQVLSHTARNPMISESLIFTLTLCVLALAQAFLSIRVLAVLSKPGQPRLTSLGIAKNISLNGEVVIPMVKSVSYAYRDESFRLSRTQCRIARTQTWKTKSSFLIGPILSQEIHSSKK